MRSYLRITFGCALIGSVSMLAACGKKAADDSTNVVEMNASDGTMNDMTVVESATLDQAGSNAAENIAADNGSDNNM